MRIRFYILTHMFILFILNFLLYILIIPCGALIREPHMFWFQQWTVLPLGKHKPPRAVVVVIATAVAMAQICQRIGIETVVVATTSQPETTGFLVFRHDLVVVGKVAPTTNLSVAGGFKDMLGIIGIPVVPQLLGVVAHGIPCPLQGLARSNHLLDEHRQEGDVLGLDLGQVFRHIFLRIFINYSSFAGAVDINIKENL